MNINFDPTRPLALTPARVPVAVAPTAQARALGQPAVAALVWLEPAAAQFRDRTSTCTKIYNYMGSASAKGEGATLSIIEGQKVSVQRNHTVRINKVEDARGIPPRGRPV